MNKTKRGAATSTWGSSVHGVAAVQGKAAVVQIVIQGTEAVLVRAVPKIHRAELVTAAAAADVQSPVETVRGKAAAAAEACCMRRHWGVECYMADTVE